jgi:hypothetical protein
MSKLGSSSTTLVATTACAGRTLSPAALVGALLLTSSAPAPALKKSNN